ncbi:protein of unknown function (plasmid) [Shinella sp. WSC3-e]|nr:protein of unknown function [Shinella sp. WSC3-e]
MILHSARNVWMMVSVCLLTGVFLSRSCQRLKGERGLTACLHIGGAIAGCVTLAPKLGPLEETGPIMAKPAVLDAEDHPPRHDLGGQAAAINRPMLRALFLTAKARGRKGADGGAALAGFLRAGRVHDLSGVGNRDVAGRLFVLVMGIAASEGHSPHDAVRLGEFPRFQQFSPIPRHDQIDGVPPAGGRRGGIVVTVRRAVAGDFQTQHGLDVAHIGMVGQERMAKAEGTRLIVIGAANLDGKAEHARRQVPRRRQIEIVRDRQGVVDIENSKVGRKALHHKRNAQRVDVRGIHDHILEIVVEDFRVRRRGTIPLGRPVFQ